jgi:hypothetical protein
MYAMFKHASLSRANHKLQTHIKVFKIKFKSKINFFEFFTVAVTRK